MSSYQCINVKEAIQLMATKDPMIFDVRSAEAYQMGRIEGALHLDNGNLFTHLNHIDRSRPVLMYCQMGVSSKEAANIFAQYGFSSVYSLDGGFNAWMKAQSSMGHEHEGCCGCDH